MSEASLDTRDVSGEEVPGDGPASASTGNDVQRQREGLRYHKKGHNFYKARYYRTKTRLSRMRLIALALTITMTLFGLRAITVMQENTLLENRISELERALYQRASR